MRTKKNREVNIFSASVVDLFASGLGVFLIVAILALVNQKKDNSSSEMIESTSKSITTGNSELEKEIVELKSEIKNLQKKEINLKMDLVAKFASESKKVESKSIANENLVSQNKELQEKLEAQERKISKLERELAEAKLAKTTDSVENTLSFDLELGSKIQLPNVQFYAGTDKPIQPYALLEIKALAKTLIKNPEVTVEVSGHIFLSEKEIRSREVFDKSNLSGRRAQVVCDQLVELGVSRKRLRCVGYGGSRYLYLTNDQYSEEAQLNRRVEVEVIGK